METSKQMQSEKVPNLRDLGGMKGAGGKRIREGMLIRSEQLYNASEQDKALLAGLPLRKIIDFRNSKEAAEKPDPAVSGSEYLNLSIIDESTLVSWETDKSEQSRQEMAAAKSDPQAGIQGMCEMYRNFVRMPFSREQYARFLREILNAGDGAVLWHCTLGKDRCGWGTVLVQAVLGVSREDILKDYLYTNECLKDEIAGMMALLEKLTAQTSLKNAGMVLMEAREEYLLAGLDEAEKLYGSMEAFLEQGLGVDASMREQFRSRYLTAENAQESN